MFKVGEFVSYGSIGVCKVEGITKIAMERKEKPKDYYILRPVYDQKRTIYSPVESSKIMIRKNISEEETYRLLERIPEMEVFVYENKKIFETKCKEAVMSGSCEEWLRLIKTLIYDRYVRTQQGRKITSTNERYLHDAEARLYGELSVALKKEVPQIEDYIRSLFKQNMC